MPERTLKEVRLLEFGPVVYPAYLGATAGVRSLTDWFHAGRVHDDDGAKHPRNQDHNHAMTANIAQSSTHRQREGGTTADATPRTHRQTPRYLESGVHPRETKGVSPAIVGGWLVIAAEELERVERANSFERYWRAVELADGGAGCVARRPAVR